MREAPVKNPKALKSWTKKQYALFAEQVDKYFQKDGFKKKGPDHFDSCLICHAVTNNVGLADCTRCPLGDGHSYNSPCLWQATYIGQSQRWEASRATLLKRGEYLVAQFAINGVKIKVTGQSMASKFMRLINRIRACPWR